MRTHRLSAFKGAQSRLGKEEKERIEEERRERKVFLSFNSKMRVPETQREAFVVVVRMLARQEQGKGTHTHTLCEERVLLLA